jgi:ribosomal protein S18 acetylase RimI-like enzyme
MTIRAFQETDIDAIKRIYTDSKLDELRFENAQFELLPLEQDSKRFAEFRESQVFVYQLNNQVVAYGAVFESHIRAIFVHSDYRRLGIGREILAYFITIIEGDVSLNVAKSNAPAKDLYQQYGFKVVKEFNANYNGTNAIANTMKLNR